MESTDGKNWQNLPLGVVANMNREILNHTELADIIGRVEYSVEHLGLIKALQESYPTYRFRVVNVRRGLYSTGGIFTAGYGERVAISHSNWLVTAYHAAERCAQSVWEENKNLGYVTSEYHVEQVYIAMPYGAAPVEFVQILVAAYHEVTYRPLFDITCGGDPKELKDLLHPLIFPTGEQVEVSPWFYTVLKVTDFANFYRKMIGVVPTNQIVSIPEMDKKVCRDIYFDGGQTVKKEVPFLSNGLPSNWLDEPNGETRLLIDWEESSAGKSGHFFCDHWLLNLIEYDHEGHHRFGYIPYWSVERGMKLPKIGASQAATNALLIDMLQKFDVEAGYPMSWYFHMLNGNRLNYAVGIRVAQAIRAGSLDFPSHDMKVISRWQDNPYEF